MASEGTETGADTAETQPELTPTEVINKRLRDLGRPRKKKKSHKDSARIEDAIDLVAIELLREAEEGGVELSATQADERARDMVKAFIEERRDGGKEYFTWLDRPAPTSVSPARDKIYDDPEVWAIRHLPEFQRFEQWYLNAEEGRPGNRKIQLAVLFEMAYKPNTKALSEALKQFQRCAPSLSWSYGHPVPVSAPALRNSIRASIRRVPLSALEDLHRALFRRLSGLCDADGEVLHPDAGRRFAVDAQWIRADELQRGLPAASEKRRAMRSRRWKSKFRIYRRELGAGQHPSFKKVRGYMQVSLCCLATGVSVMTRLVPANGDEPRVFWQMWLDLKGLEPDLPIEYVIGDSLYARDNQYAHKLWFEYGVHLITPTRKNMLTKGAPHAASYGVPMCICGREKPMKLKDQNGGLWNRERRLREGLKDGESSPLTGHLRWVCPDGVCPQVHTYPHVQPQLYTQYPHRGDHKKVQQRQAMLARRNGIESLHSVFKGIGWGLSPLRFGGDDEHEWILTFAHALLVARRIVHENGDYDRAVELWRALGLDKPVSRSEPGCELTLQRLREAEAEHLAASIPDSGAIDLWPGEAFAGYHAQSTDESLAA